MKRVYGASLLHLLTVVGCLVLTVLAVLPVLETPQALRIGLWFLGAVVLHDFVLYPLYAAADRALPRRAVNHVRVPALLSGLLLLMFWPVVFQHSEAAYRNASGLSQDVFWGRYLAIVAVLFAASGVHFLVRGRRRT